MAYPQPMFPYPANPLGLQNCINRFTYMWLRNGDNFWFFLTAVGESIAYGYRFFGGRWNQYSIGLREIGSYNCSPVPTLY